MRKWMRGKHDGLIRHAKLHAKHCEDAAGVALTLLVEGEALLLVVAVVALSVLEVMLVVASRSNHRSKNNSSK